MEKDGAVLLPSLFLDTSAVPLQLRLWAMALLFYIERFKYIFKLVIVPVIVAPIDFVSAVVVASVVAAVWRS